MQVESLNLESSSQVDMPPAYDDPRKYNHILYPMAEGIRAQGKMGDFGVQRIKDFGMTMIAGSELMGVHPSFTQGARMRISAIGVMSERFARDFNKPVFGLNETQIDGELVAVTEEVVEGQDFDFGRLLHFKRETDRNDPPVLIVAPMSGHYATLLRDTVRQLLPYHDVYITDMENARNVPVDKGEFGIDDNIDYIKSYIKEIGPDTNVVAVCQAAVTALATISYFAQTEPEMQPNSMTLMGGPLDVKAKGAETVVTEFGSKHDIEWFRDKVTTKVPDRFIGAGRLVYPGFMQLASFMGMNMDKHLSAHGNLFEHLNKGADGKADADRIIAFYDEYRSVSDLPRRFYLETINKVFINQDLANGVFDYRGFRINPAEINKTAVLTVEAESDDISAPNQTVAVQKWLTGLKPNQHYHHLQPGIGHYGIFNGSKWGNEIAPRITSFIRQTANSRSGLKYDPIPATAKVIKPTLWHP